MFVLLGIGLLAGFVTAMSPCVLPVLPILLAGGATGRKPLRIVTGLVASFVAFTLFLNRVLGPKPKASSVKLEPFECGATPVSTLNVKAVPIKYYAVAIIFILFDLETVFLYILALGAQPFTGFMLLTFLLFIFLLVLLLLYVYKARLLEAVTQ